MVRPVLLTAGPDQSRFMINWLISPRLWLTYLLWSVCWVRVRLTTREIFCLVRKKNQKLGQFLLSSFILYDRMTVSETRFEKWISFILFLYTDTITDTTWSTSRWEFRDVWTNEEPVLHNYKVQTTPHPLLHPRRKNQRRCYI